VFADLLASFGIGYAIGCSLVVVAHLLRTGRG